MADFRGRVESGDPVVSVSRTGADVVVSRQSGASERFDRCLLACHADDALAMLAAPDAEERRVLGAFRYTDNLAVLHRDRRLMPRRRRLWSSWNYLGGADGALTVSYWMNRLQPLTTTTDHFVTLNPAIEIAPSETIARIAYRHPMYDQAAIEAQARLWSLQGRGGVWFAG
ncbi:MAG: NAD/FAD-binding protein, partial [Hyphomicrobium sp.]